MPSKFTMKKYLLIFIVLIYTQTVQSQDPQFSQFYAAQNYLNPAFVGSGNGVRATLNHRMQWPKLGATFNTTAFSLDYNWQKANSGLGVLVVTNQISEAALSSTDINLQYAYNLQLNDNYYFRPGLQVGYSLRSLDYSKLVFTDQLGEDGLISTISGENFNTDNLGFFDVSAGGILYSDKLWFGASVHHINRPNETFLDADNRLPMKFSVHGGYKIILFQKTYRSYKARNRQSFNEEEISITPVFNYKKQGQFDQFDIGTYFNYSPIVLGFLYRGLPIKNYTEGIYNNESIIALAGIRWNGMSIGYSYDFTISSLAGNTGGSHEFSISYDFPVKQVKRGRKKIKRTGLPCPTF